MTTTDPRFDFNFASPDYRLVKETPRCAGYWHGKSQQAIIVGATWDFDTDHPVFDQIQAQMRDYNFRYITDQGVLLRKGIWVNYWVFSR